MGRIIESPDESKGAEKANIVEKQSGNCSDNGCGTKDERERSLPFSERKEAKEAWKEKIRRGSHEETDNKRK